MFGHRPGGVRAASLPLLLSLLVFTVVVVHGIPQTADPAAAGRIEELRAEIARHDEAYFRQANPTITDTDYDRLKRELLALERAYPDLARAARGVGDDRSGRFPTRVHRVRMLSLDKAYTEGEWRAFHDRLARQLGRTDLTFVIEPKYDGLAVSLTYEQGLLVRAVTRGNGAEGDDVTANVRTIQGLPAELRTDRSPPPALVELRAEVYLEQTEFTRINAEREAAGEELFTHPRNLAAGTLKLTDPAEVAERRLSVVIHGWGAWEGAPVPAMQQAFHAQVRAWGLPVVANPRVARTADAVWSVVRTLGLERAGLGFPIDGAVVKLDDTALRARMGDDENAPRWAIACKYQPERATTRLHAITIQVGRTGLLTPVAEFDPVELGGTTVERATLHNRAEIARRDIRVGDIVEVEKSGEIIPAVVGVRRDWRPVEAKPYVFPNRCPSCQVPVAAKPDEVAVRCANPRCPAQRQRRLEHFVSAQAVDINGIGPATIAALIEAGQLQSPADFYRLRREDLLRIGGIGEKTADKLLAAIERSKTAALWRFIYGLGIPQVGAVTSRDLARRGGDLAGFARLDANALAGTIGAAAVESLAAFLRQPENQAEIRALLAAGVRPGTPAGVVAKPDVAGKVFVFTGTLPDLTRAQAAERVRVVGGLVRDSVSGQTDYLVVGEGAGGKLAEAQALGVKVINVEEFKRLVGME